MNGRTKLALPLTLIITIWVLLALPSPISTQNLLPESTFDNGTSGAWWGTANLDVEIRDGQFCATTTDDGGENLWDTSIGHVDLNFEQGRLYDLHFDLYVPTGINVAALVQMGVEPWTEYYAIDITGGETARDETQGDGGLIHYESPYRQVSDDSSGQFGFQFGGQGAATICIDNVYLGPPSVPPIVLNAVQTNQLGYFANGAKQATVTSPATSPLVWTLLDGSNTTARQGTTTVFGSDEGSGLHVHQIDFSSYTNVGSGYTIQVGATSSHPFEISPNPYSDLLYDAVRYYYFARSTDPLEMPYVDNPQWVREAGPADDSVACWPSRGGSSGCDYRLDVSKGWHDAGDYGKYIVNSGFSIWQLLNIYERGVHSHPNTLTRFADNTMNIPESGNGISDLLDEVRYNLEFMLGMQVPNGEPLAGMVHHKMHNTIWHELGTSPFGTEEDGTAGDERYLTPPTTIATLYFAGATAQCARVWATIDPAFSAQCRSAAEQAWNAAITNPAQTHPDEPYNNGGGPYGNLDSGDAILDEFYWAASELFITTGEQEYRTYLLASPNHLAPAQVPISSFQIDAIARISLSLVPNALPQTELNRIKNTLIDLADIYVENVASSGFGVPIFADQYYWGSNNTLLNEVMVLAVAYDLTSNERYLAAAQEGTNYIFGRNPLGQSYVTGHGEQATVTPTHTWYANVVNPNRPIAPPGFLTGGANITHPDIFSTEALTGCVGSTCYIDHIRAYSTNEPAINVNSSLVWVTGFLASESIAAPTATRNVLYLPLFGR